MSQFKKKESNLFVTFNFKGQVFSPEKMLMINTKYVNKPIETSKDNVCFIDIKGVINYKLNVINRNCCN